MTREQRDDEIQQSRDDCNKTPYAPTPSVTMTLRHDDDRFVKFFTLDSNNNDTIAFSIRSRHHGEKSATKGVKNCTAMTIQASSMRQHHESRHSDDRLVQFFTANSENNDITALSIDFRYHNNKPATRKSRKLRSKGHHDQMAR